MGARAGERDCRYTARQSQILGLVALGLSDKRIATRLGLSVATIRAHLQRFYRSNGAENRAAAVAIWIRHRSSSGAFPP